MALRPRHLWHPVASGRPARIASPCPMRGRERKESMENKFTALLKSRKFWAAVIGLALIVARNLIPNFLPFGDQEITAVILVLISYILGTALEDAGAMYARARK